MSFQLMNSKVGFLFKQLLRGQTTESIIILFEYFTRGIIQLSFDIKSISVINFKGISESLLRMVLLIIMLLKTKNQQNYCFNVFVKVNIIIVVYYMDKVLLESKLNDVLFHCRLYRYTLKLNGSVHIRTLHEIT